MERVLHAFVIHVGLHFMEKKTAAVHRFIIERTFVAFATLFLCNTKRGIKVLLNLPGGAHAPYSNVTSSTNISAAVVIPTTA